MGTIEKNPPRVLKPLVWLIFWKSKHNKKASFDDTASPGTTAILSDEELSSGHHTFMDGSDFDSTYAVAPYFDGRSPYSHNKDDDDPSQQTEQEETATPAYSKDRKLLRWRQHVGRSWIRLWKRRNSEPLITKEDTPEEYDDENMDVQSARFSVTTERDLSKNPQYKIYEVRAKESEYSPPPVPDEKKKNGVSLREFLEDKKQSENALSPSAIHIGDMSVQECSSFGSAFLAVSYDQDDCAQLVLKASSSSEDSEDKILNDLLSDQPLGIKYPHPAGDSVGSTSYDSVPTTIRKKSDCATPHWLSEKIDRVWEQIDGDPLEDDLSEYPESMQIERKETDWNLGWSFSQESAVSFASILGKDISHLANTNMMSPLCGFNDVPYDEAEDLRTELSSVTNPTYRMEDRSY